MILACDYCDERQAFDLLKKQKGFSFTRRKAFICIKNRISHFLFVGMADSTNICMILS